MCKVLSILLRVKIVVSIVNCDEVVLNIVFVMSVIIICEF